MKLLPAPPPDYSDLTTVDENGKCLMCNGVGRRIYTFLGRLVADVCGVCGGKE